MSYNSKNSLETSDMLQNSIDIHQLQKDLHELSSEENLLDEDDDIQDKENQQKYSNYNNINFRKNDEKSSKFGKLKQKNNFYKKENEKLRQQLFSLKTDLINKYDELKLNNQTICNKFELKTVSSLDEQRIKYEGQIERLRDQVKNLEEEAIERKKNFRDRNQQLYNMVLKLEKEKQEMIEKNIKLIHNRFSSRHMDETLDNPNLNSKSTFNTLQHEPKMSTKCNQLVTEYRCMLDNNNSLMRSRNQSIQPQSQPLAQRVERVISYDQPFSSKLHNINDQPFSSNLHNLKTDYNAQKRNIYDQYLTIDALQLSKDEDLPKPVQKIQTKKDDSRTSSIPLKNSMVKSQMKNHEPPTPNAQKDLKKKQKKCPKTGQEKPQGKPNPQEKQRVPVYSKINR